MIVVANRPTLRDRVATPYNLNMAPNKMVTYSHTSFHRYDESDKHFQQVLHNQWIARSALIIGFNTVVPFVSIVISFATQSCSLIWYLFLRCFDNVIDSLYV